MQEINEPTLEFIGTEPIKPKDGWKTSQGQLTAIFTIVCLVLAWFGINTTPDQLDSWVTIINNICDTILPIIVAGVTLIQYIISRGKIQSNTINANAAVQVAQASTPTPALVSLAENDPLTGLIGGESWKDPERYENLTSIAAQLGVPGADKVDTINQNVKPKDLIKGILASLHKKKRT